MALRVAVAHNHRHVLAYAFRAQSRFGKRCRHREEIDHAVVFRADDAGHFGVFDVDVVDRHVAEFAVRQFFDFLVNRHRLRGVGRKYVVAEAEVQQTFRALFAVAKADNLARHAGALLGFIAAEHTALAARADNQNRIAGLYELGRLGRRAGYVQSRKREVFGQVGRNLGIDAAFKQNGLAVDVHLVDVGADVLDFVNAQGRKRERNQGRDFVAFLEVDFAFERVADFLYRAEQHTARTRYGVAVLALFFHDAEHDFGNLGLVAAGLFFNLRKAGGVDVQRLYVNEDFIVVEHVHVVVDFVGRLGQNALGRNDAVCTVFVSFRLHNVL